MKKYRSLIIFFCIYFIIILCNSKNIEGLKKYVKISYINIEHGLPITTVDQNHTLMNIKINFKFEYFFGLKNVMN